MSSTMGIVLHGYNEKKHNARSNKPTTKNPYVDITFGWQILIFKTTK
jgi:hypothetical protein